MKKRFYIPNRVEISTFILLMLGTVLCWITSYYVRFSEFLIPVTKGFVPVEEFYRILPFIIITFIVYINWLNVHFVSSEIQIWKEIASALKLNLLALLTFTGFTYFIREIDYSRAVLIIFTLTNTLFTVMVKIIATSVTKRLGVKSRDYKKAIIVGTGRLAQRLSEILNKNTFSGVKIAGFVSISSDGNVNKEKTNKNTQVLCELPKLKETIHKEDVEQVFIAIPFNEYNNMKNIMNQLTDEVVDIKIVPDNFAFDTLKQEISELNGLTMISIRESPLKGWNLILKRTFDIVVSLLALIILSPIFILIMIAIKLTSKGKVFYIQERMGLDGRAFKMLKFRTMKEDSEEKSGPVWAKENDPRRTKLGRFLRRTSLDEIPQFINVLKGEMSVVGPRPERAFFIEQFRKMYPGYTMRLKMKAGITGWAQINGWRGNTSLRKRLQYDLYYIRNWSIWFDCWITFLTLFRGIFQKNAY